MQPVDAGDGEGRGANALDFAAHRHQHIAKVDNFRFAGGIFENAGAIGQHRRHQRIFCRADRHHREGKIAAGQAAIGDAGNDIATGGFDCRAERLDRLQVQVDRPVTDRAAAG